MKKKPLENLAPLSDQVLTITPKDTSFSFNAGLYPLFNVTPQPEDSTLLRNYEIMSQTSPSNSLVKILLGKVNYLVARTKIQYVDDFDDKLLKYKIDSLVFSSSHSKQLTREDSIKISKDFFAKRESALAFNDTALFLISFSRSGKQILMDVFASALAISVPIKTKIAQETPSLVTLLDNDELMEIQSLHNTTSVDRIRENYSNLILSEAIRHISEESIRSYKSISIFGFEFSKRRLPWVFGFFCAVALFGITAMVDSIKKTGKVLLENINEDHIAGMFIENKALRFIIWCVAPVFIMYSSFPKWQSVEYSVIACIFFVLSVRVFLRSLKA